MLSSALRPYASLPKAAPSRSPTAERAASAWSPSFAPAVRADRPQRIVLAIVAREAGTLFGVFLAIVLALAL